MSILIPPIDAAWLYAEKPNMPAHIGCLSIYRIPDGTDERFLGELAEVFRAAPVTARPFNYVIKMDGIGRMLPFWDVLEAEQVDLDYHFRHSALPRPGGERELGNLVSRLHCNALDRSRPLWEVHLIEGLARNRFAIYIKAHHALFDGVAGARLLQRMLSPDAGQRLMAPPWAMVEPTHDAARGERSEPVEPLWPQLRRQARTTLAALRALAGNWFESDTQLARPFAAPTTELNRRICGKRRFATQNYALPRVQLIAERAGVTINDVFVAVCAGALRRYLIELDKLPRKPLVAGIPVSFRQQDDRGSGNAISFILASLHTDIADPLARLQACSKSASAAKRKLRQLPNESMSQYTMMFMAPYMMQVMLGVGGYLRPMHNLIISNVPGPAQPLYLNGAMLEEIYPISLLFNGEALNISVVSYNGRFNLGYTGCRDSLPHMQRIAVYTGDALGELEQALGIRRRRRAA